MPEGSIQIRPASVLLFLAAAPLFAASEHRHDTNVHVQLVVRAGRGGPPVPNAYIALVPPDRPWSRPLVETVAADGKASFDVPPGKYRITAAAAGVGGAVTQPTTISAHDATAGNIAITLLPPRLLTGTVRDEEGRPLRDVVVADVNSVIAPPHGRLSALAMREFGASWRTASGEDGAWSLSLPREAVSPIVAEAPGYAVAWRAHDADLKELELRRGGGLRVLADRADPAFILTLATPGGEVPASWQAQYWARAADRDVLEWSSLAEGLYEVFTQQPDRRTFTRAVRLGSILVKRGETSELRVTLPPATPVAANVRTVFLDGTTRKGLDTLEVFAGDANGVPTRIEHALETSTGGTLVYVSTAAPHAFATTADSFFFAALDPDPLRAAPATAHDLGHAGLHIRSGEEELALPRAGIARFHRCAGDTAVTMPVAVQKDGTTLFPAPSGCESVVLQFDPFGVVAVSKPIAAVQPTWLGDYTLHAPGTAGIHVLNDAGEPVGEATVTVSATTDAGARLISLGTAKTAPDGWIDFERLPAGRQLVAAAQNADGDQSPPESFRVQPRARTIVDGVTIARAASLTLEPRLDAGFLERFPEGYVQAVVLDAEDANIARISKEVVEGRVEIPRIAPGSWRMTALISTGRGAQPVRGGVVTLESGETRRESPKLTPLVFTGRVTEDGKGFDGMIDIRGTERTDVYPAIATRAGGFFEVLLPRRDVYEVEVRTAEPFRVVSAGDVAFHDPAQPVVIELPASEVVVVVREGDAPVPESFVAARGNRDSVKGMQSLRAGATTDRRGEARLRLRPGSWTISASDGLGRHARKQVAVSRDEPARVDLTLDSRSTLSGAVRELFGAPAAGATVECAIPDANGSAQLETATTADDGTFSIEHDAGPSPVFCSVNSSFGAQGFRVAPGEMRELVLPERTGRLRIASLPRSNRMQMLWLIAKDGRLVNVSRYIRPGSETDSLEVPALAPDDWTLVRISSTTNLAALTRGAATALPTIATVSLGPGQTKSIDLRDPKEGTEGEDR